MEVVEKYQEHLDRVSRSFAVCIARLESPLRRYVGLTYLLCRILDTLEDAPWRKPESQIAGLKQFENVIANGLPPNPALWPDLDVLRALPSGEKSLLIEAPSLLADLHALPNAPKSAIRDLLVGMSRGMQHFAQKSRMELKNLYEVNQYCFFVAGIVGETLARIVNGVDASMGLNLSLVRDAHHFGLFLQKVNLLKDQVQDEREGRFFIPSRREVYQSLKINAEGAMRYIERIPKSRSDYKLFCLWSLFLGLKTLPLLRSNDLPQSKLVRQVTMRLFNEIELHVTDAEWLSRKYNEIVADAQFDFNWSFDRSESITAHWISDCYKGALGKEDFEILGLIS